MASDEFLLDLPFPVLRFYGWIRPTLSFGKSNTWLHELDIDYCKRMEFDGVKRQTGGKTVMHHYELTYSFAANSEQFPRSILETYRLISQPLAAAFAQLGLKTEMTKEKKSANNSSICFNETSSYEITANKRKLVGSAQYRKRHRFIQHGAILLDIDWVMWKKIWKLSINSKLLENRITSFQDQLDSVPPVEDITQAITTSFASSFDTDLVTYTFSKIDKEKIEQLRPKYQWHW